MPPTERFVPTFAAEPPQEPLPSGRWADTLASQFMEAVAAIDAGDEDLGTPGDIRWFPDRTYGGRTYQPATALTSTGLELFGFVSFSTAEEEEPADFHATADFTAETADENPAWKLDLCDEVIDTWRGEKGNRADITLVWGVALVPRGAVVTAELADLTVDQCVIEDERFTLLAPDNYRGDFIDVKMWNRGGHLVATESLYVDDEDDDSDED